MYGVSKGLKARTEKKQGSRTLVKTLEEVQDCAHVDFIKYQLSTLGTIKFPLLDHVCRDLRAMAHVGDLHAGL